PSRRTASHGERPRPSCRDKDGRSCAASGEPSARPREHLMADAISTKPDDFSTVIGPDAQFKGELTFQGGVRVDGQFEGTIQTPGKVFVSKGGKLKAEVKAGHIALEGQVDGNLNAEDRIELRATAQLRGAVRTNKLLVVEDA